MTDEQFKQLMQKLEEIQQQMQAGQWRHLYQPPQQVPSSIPWNPAQPCYPGFLWGGPSFVID